MPSFVVTLAGLLIWSGVVLILTTAGLHLGDHPHPGRHGRRHRQRLPQRRSAGGSWAAARRRPVRRCRRLRTASLASRGRPGRQAAWSSRPPDRRPGGRGVRRPSGTPTSDRGVPVVDRDPRCCFLVFWSFVAARTRFGRHVYAVGGNPEAARRAGINVDRVRIAVFMISGFMAGVGGIILASRLRSVATSTGRRQPAAQRHRRRRHRRHQPVRRSGRVVAALLGAFVIASISNGMDLLGLPPGTKFVDHRARPARRRAGRRARRSGGRRRAPGLRRGRARRGRAELGRASCATIVVWP